MDMGLGELRELVMDREAWHAVVHGVTKSRTWLSDWTDWLILLTDWSVAGWKNFIRLIIRARMSPNL